MTAPQPCPYLPGREERKVFANLPYVGGSEVNDSLTMAGFRRSQAIAYRPVCETCSACASARIPVADYVFSRSERRTLNRSRGLMRCVVEAEATPEQYDLLQRYLGARHPGGGMSDMSWRDYVAMVEETTVRTHLIEYREPGEGGGPGALVACVLVDQLGDGLSMVYSFYSPDHDRQSLGVYMVLDHVIQAGLMGLPYIYLGYFVSGARKMAYKAAFSPLELLRPHGWTLMTAGERARSRIELLEASPRDPAANPASARKARPKGPSGLVRKI